MSWFAYLAPDLKRDMIVETGRSGWRWTKSELVLGMAPAIRESAKGPQLFTVASLLFLIMDPIGNAAVVHSLLIGLPPRQQVIVLLREGLIATTLLVLAAVLGQSFLTLLGLDECALRVAGGIVLFLIALGMLFPLRRMIEEPTSETPLVVPIAVPLIAGPSAISMVVLFAEEHSPATVVPAVLLASAAAVGLLASSSLIMRFLGRRGAQAIERLMGMLLIMLSVQMVLDGIDAFLRYREATPETAIERATSSLPAPPEIQPKTPLTRANTPS